MNNDPIFFISDKPAMHFSEPAANLAPLIDWLNSFNDPYCLLVNSLDDLKDGIAFCHVVAFIACSPADQEKVRQLIYYDAATNTHQQELSLQNLDLAINILKNSALPIPQEAVMLTAQAILEDESNLALFLETLKQTHDILNFNQSHQQSAKPSQSKPPQSSKHDNSIRRSTESSRPNYLMGEESSDGLLPPIAMDDSISTPYNREMRQENQPRQSIGNASSAKNFNPHFASQGNIPQPFSQVAQNSGWPQVSAHKGSLNNLMITPRGQAFSNNQNIQMSGNRRFESSLENISPIGPKISISPNAITQQNYAFDQHFDNSYAVKPQKMNILEWGQDKTTNANQNNQDYMTIGTSDELGNTEKTNFEKMEGQNHFQNLNNFQGLGTIEEKNQEEIQLEKEIEEINVSYMNTKHSQLQQFRTFAAPYNNSFNKAVHVQIGGTYDKNDTQHYSKSSHPQQKSFSDSRHSHITSHLRDSRTRIAGGSNDHSRKEISSINSSMNRATKAMIKQHQENCGDYQNVIRSSFIKQSNSKTVDANFVPPTPVQRPKQLESKQASILQGQKLFDKSPKPQKRAFISDGQQTNITQNQTTISESHHQPKHNQSVTSQGRSQLHEITHICANKDKGQRGLSSDDDIMNEMQTLTVLPQSKERNLVDSELKIDPVDQKTKFKILDWLTQEVKLLRSNPKLIDDLPMYCKNGVFFCDLVNRLNGKHPIIKGIERAPKNTTTVLANLTKVFEYFRAFPRFCPRYLWSERQVALGDNDLIWGLLDDMWHWHFNKISPFDPSSAQQQQQQQQQQTVQQRTLTPPRVAEKQHLPPKSKPTANKSSMGMTNVTTPKGQKSRQGNLSIQTVNRDHQKMIDEEFDRAQSGTNQQHQLAKDRSYCSLRNQRTPMRNNRDLPLQSYSAKGKGSETRQGSKSKRRRDISNINSPIAKDQTGQFYYQNGGDKSLGEREALALLNGREGSQGMIKVTDEIVNEVRSWLFSLRFTAYLSKEFEFKDICGDPFANGLLVAELFSFLEKVTVFSVIHHPTTITECRENVSKVLSVIRQRRKDFPSRLLTEQAVESVLKRDRQTIFSILFYLKVMYPDVTGPKSPVARTHNLSVMSGHQSNSHQSQNLQLPYSPAELKLLETSILNWLKSLGVLGKIIPPHISQDIQSMLEVQIYIQNGVLLCELVSTIFNTKIPGVFRDPKTDATCLQNIRKALEVIRRQTRMSQKFTWAEKEIQEGQLTVLIGLLEDLHRCFDGVPPRKRGDGYFADGPYLGDTLYQVQPHLRLKLQGVTGNDAYDSSRPYSNTGFSNGGNSQGGMIIDKDFSKPRSLGGLRNLGTQDNIQSTGRSVANTHLVQMTERNKFQEVPSLLSYRQTDSYGTNQISLFQNQAKLINAQSNQGGSTLSPQKQQNQSNERKANFGQFLNVKLQKEQQNSDVNLLINQTNGTQASTILQPHSRKNTITLSPQSSIEHLDRTSFERMTQPGSLFPSLKPHSRPNQILTDEDQEAQMATLTSNRFSNVKALNEVLFNQNSQHKRGGVYDTTQQSYQTPSLLPLQQQFQPSKSPISGSRGRSIEFDDAHKSNIKRPSIISMEDYENEEHSRNKTAFTQREKSKIIQWLHKQDISLPKGFNLDEEPITFFKDGILLCQLVSSLEKQSIDKMQQNPKSSASCLQNIKKALTVLKKKNQIPLYLLYSEEEIYNGSGEIIFQLLKSLRQAYKAKGKVNNRAKKL